MLVDKAGGWEGTLGPRARVAAGMLFGAAVAAGLAWAHSRNVGTYFYDPDDALRLTQLRDWLGGQPWGDIDQHRMQPGGTHMHWSRVSDLAPAAVISSLRGWMGTEAAERVALVATPVALVVPLAATVAGVAGRAALGVAVAMLSLCSWALLDRFAPGRIDHHAIMTALATLACASLLWRRERVAGACAGLATAACLAVGFEDLAVLAMLGAGTAILWALADGRERALGYGAALAFGAVASEAFIPTSTRWETACDCLSGPWPATLLAAGGGLWLMARRPPVGWVARLAWLATLGGAAALPLALGGAGKCLAGPYPGLSGTAASYWLSRVGEMADVIDAAGGEWGPLASAGTAVILASFVGLCAVRDGRRPSPAEACYATLALAAAIIGARYIRSSGLPVALAAPVLGRGVARMAGVQRVRMGTTVAAALAMAAAVPAVVLYGRLADDAAPGGVAGTLRMQCESRDAWEPLSTMPPALVVAPIDLGPEVLAYTRLSVMAGGIHRASHGIDEQYEFLQGSEAESLAVAERDGVEYVAWCDDNGEMLRSARWNPNGLAGRLAQDRLPDWLVRMPGQGPVLAARVDRTRAMAARTRLARVVADLPPAPPVATPAR